MHVNESRFDDRVLSGQGVIEPSQGGGRRFESGRSYQKSQTPRQGDFCFRLLRPGENRRFDSHGQSRIVPGSVISSGSFSMTSCRHRDSSSALMVARWGSA